jgi:hypothetical protein
MEIATMSMRTITAFPFRIKVHSNRRVVQFLILTIFFLLALPVSKSGLFAWGGFVAKASANSSAALQPKPYDLPDVDNYVNIPYFVNSGKITSTLVLNNNLPNVAQAEVTLFNRHGEPLKLPIFTLPPFSAERFNLAELTSGVPGDFSSGNIQIFYHAPMMTITSQVTVDSTSKRISFESNASSAMDFHSNQLNAIIWLPNNETLAKAALTNTTLSPITVTAQVGRENRTIILGARETQVIELRDFVPAGTDGTLTSLLTLKHSGDPGALVATGFAYNEQKGFSTNLPFVDRSTIATKTLAGAHFKFGPAAFNTEFPWGTTFRAPLVLANLSNSPVLANVIVDYTSKAIPNRIALRSIRLEAKQIKQIDLAQELANRGLTGPVDDAGIQITYTGQLGSLMARLTSVDETGDFAFDTPIKDPLAGMFRVSGNYPWRLDENYNTVVHLKNTTNREAYAVVQIRYEGGNYNPDKIKLAPYQTVALDIRELRDAQEKDIRDGMMPLDVTRGQILWYEQTLDSLIGRAESFAVANGLSSSFSCGGGGQCGQSFSTSSMFPLAKSNVLSNTGILFTPQETDTDCFHTPLGPFSITSGITWSSTNMSVATVDASSGYVTCLAGGTTSILASWNATVYACGGGNCQQNPATPTASGSLTVQVPSSLSVKSISVLATGTSGDYGCLSSADYGIKVKIKYQVNDQNGTAIKSSLLEPQEKVTNQIFNGGTPTDPAPNYQDIGPTRISGTSQFTDSNGIFFDAPYGACGPGSFTMTATQNIGILLGGTLYPVKTNNITVSTTGLGSGSLTNGSDVVKSRP